MKVVKNFPVYVCVVPWVSQTYLQSMEDYRLLLGMSLTSVLARPLLGLWAHTDKMYVDVVPFQLSLLVHLASLLLLQSAWLQPVKCGLQRNVCDQVAKLHEPFANVMSQSIRKDNIRN